MARMEQVAEEGQVVIQAEKEVQHIKAAQVHLMLNKPLRGVVMAAVEQAETPLSLADQQRVLVVLVCHCRFRQQLFMAAVVAVVSVLVVQRGSVGLVVVLVG